MWIKRKGKSRILHTLDIVQSQPGDVIITESGGSGAVGSPVDREVDKVRWDVLNEYISAETARKIYKVVIDPKTFEVNYEATSKLRKRTKPRLTV